MKIHQLRQIIREEVRRVINEDNGRFRFTAKSKLVYTKIIGLIDKNQMNTAAKMYYDYYNSGVLSILETNKILKYVKTKFGDDGIRNWKKFNKGYTP